MATPEQVQIWIKSSSVEELCKHVIWENIMEGTAHCGWSQRAREGLVKQTQDGVAWALKTKIELGQIEVK